ncbi:hypothetical protein TNCT_68501 [Trichonephila clavata]|uniref:Uncharacterized protein n=1 Tax=Trichonephila clavata TaxID=2740835 RepID=A0A8X6HRI5_TRICU|nr:hypothetical protein TNCT_68501 [Trichonephila clavata]
MARHSTAILEVRGVSVILDRQGLPRKPNPYRPKGLAVKKRRISISKFREQIRPYKVRLGKNSSTPAFTSEEERSFTIEQIHRSPNQRSASVEVLSGDSTETSKTRRWEDVAIGEESVWRGASNRMADERLGFHFSRVATEGGDMLPKVKGIIPLDALGATRRL